MEMVQSIYITILNLVYKVTGKINERIRESIIGISVFLLFYLHICNYSTNVVDLGLRSVERHMVGYVLIAIIAIMSIKDELKPVKWNRQILMIWYALSLLVLISRIFHPLAGSYILWALALLLGFPGVYLIWLNRGDYATLFKIVSHAMQWIIIFYFVLVLLTIQADDFVSFRYYATMDNPNHVGKLAAAGVTAALYLLATERKKMISVLCCGISVTLSVLSASRTAVLVIVVQILLYIAVKGRNIAVEGGKAALSRIGIVLVGVIVVAVAANYMLLYQKDRHMEKTIIAESEKQETSADIAAMEKQNMLPSRFSIKGKNANEISSGRIDIWKYYVERLNMTGHRWKVAPIGSPERVYQWAHNDILEVSYRSGIPAGIVYSLLLLYVALQIFRCAVKRKVQPCDYFFMFTAIVYGGYAMLDVLTFPAGVQYTFMFYVALIPIFERKNELWICRKSQ